MILAQSKKTEYRIVIPSNPTEAQRYAGLELAKYLAAITGATLPIVTCDSPATGKEIVIGKTCREGTPDGRGP